MINEASLVAQMGKNLPQCRRSGFDSWVKIPWRKEWVPSPVLLPGELHGQKSMGSQRVRQD